MLKDDQHIFSLCFLISPSTFYDILSNTIHQGFPQDEVIAGCSVFITGHMAISGTAWGKLCIHYSLA